MPQPPLDQRALGVIDATELPPLCPQAGAYGTPVEYGFNGGPGDEDCLYLNVYAPAGATGLPVLVWIREFAPPCPFDDRDRDRDMSVRTTH